MENEYINEDNFEEIVLSKLFPNSSWIRNKTIPNSKRKFRPDFRNDELKLIIEFNGYQHYTKAREIINDRIKKEYFESLGFKVIEWPYFIQPTKITIKTFFNIDSDKTFNNYKQGFIDKNCVLPADFCSLGIQRFLDELSLIDKNTKKEIEDSLKQKELSLTKEEVYPINY